MKISRWCGLSHTKRKTINDSEEIYTEIEKWEAEMKRTISKDDVTAMCTLENSKKCLDNATRLFKDSRNVSLPTRLALVEIAVEELAKSMILFTNSTSNETIDFGMSILGTKDIDDLRKTKNEKWLNEIKILFNPNINMRDHKDKLRVIKDVYELFSNSYKTFVPFIDNSPFFKELVKGFGVETFNMPKYAPNYLSGIDIEMLDKFKMSGFYVDFQDRNIIFPNDIAFDKTDQLDQIFKSFAKTLKVAISLFDGTVNIEDPKSLSDIFNDL